MYLIKVQDVLNVDEILNQILKTNAKMNSLVPRLTELGSDESAECLHFEIMFFTTPNSNTGSAPT